MIRKTRSDKRAVRALYPFRPGGFTLAELLVVIGIIGVLLAILLPTLSAVRQHARTDACKAQLREIGALASHWAASHEGFLPLDGQVDISGARGTTWGAVVSDSRHRRYSYVLQKDLSGSISSGLRLDSFLVAMLRLAADDPVNAAIDRYTLDWEADVRSRIPAASSFHCPSADREHQLGDRTARGFDSMVMTRDGERFAGPWATTMDYSTNGGFLGFQPDPGRSHRAYRGRLSRVKDPSRLVLAGDGDGDFMSWTPAADRPASRVTLSDVLVESAEITHWGYWKLPQLDGRHRGGMKVLFVDGHAETVKVEADALDACELLQE